MDETHIRESDLYDYTPVLEWTIMCETPADYPEPVVLITGSADFVLGFLSGVVDWREPRESWLLTDVRLNSSHD